MSLTPANLAAVDEGQKLQYLTELVNRLESLKKEIKTKEEEIKKLSVEKEKLEKIDVPDYMMELGLNSAILLSGLSVKVEPFYYARMPPVSDNTPEAEARRSAGLKWLRDNQHGGIIKENIVIMPSLENAQLILEFLQEIHASYEEKSGVHWKTLESWFKEVVSQGQTVPMDLFSGFVGRIAKVK